MAFVTSTGPSPSVSRDVVENGRPCRGGTASTTTHAFLNGKTVIDATNNMRAPVAHSLDAIAAAAPEARAYRAFNTYGWENFADPVIGGVQADHFYAGRDGDSRALVEQLISEVGLRPINLGGPEQAGLVDALLRIWFTLAVQQGMGRRLGFKVLTP